MKRLLLLLPLLAFLAAGCKAQVAVNSQVVVLTWTAPAASTTWTGCGATGSSTACTYVVSRLTTTASTCPASTGINYTPLNQSSPAATLTYTDSTASGLTACYVVQTESAGLYSAASASAGPFTVAANPTAPTALGATTETSSTAAPQTMPALAMNQDIPRITLEGHILE